MAAGTTTVLLRVCANAPADRPLRLLKRLSELRPHSLSASSLKFSERDVAAPVVAAGLNGSAEVDAPICDLPSTEAYGVNLPRLD